ncbi:hypothetical protein ACP70R_006672 [Stipagrostis hirtigluma subsp. patula]
MVKGKGKGKLDADGPSRERSITWDDDHTKFMLDWYIEYKKNQHAGFVWKKQHHLKCADALNKQFGMGVTLAQVDRHYRDYKEKWKIVETALNKSGNGFDATRCKITVSESEKEKLNDRARRLLSKPIKFFHEMEELFLGSNADGSLAMDQETCLEDAKDSDSGDSGGINNTSCYANPVDLLDDDSDTLPSPKNLKLSPACAASGDNSSSSTLRSSMKRPRGVKSPKKKPQKPKSRFSEATEVISTTMQALVKSFAEPPPPPPLPFFVVRTSQSYVTVDDNLFTGHLQESHGYHPNSSLTQFATTQGYLAGNAFVDYWNIDGPARIPYAHRMGLISDEIYEAYKKSCIVGDRSHRSVQCANSLDTIDECVKDIFPFHILEPNCAYASPHPYNLLKPKLTLGVREMLQLQDYSTEGLHLSEISTQCRTGEYTLSRLWANDATVREALGIHKGTVPSWLRCNTDIPYSRDIQSSVKYHLDVTTKGYRSLVYSGDHDMAVPFSGTQSWIKSLNFSVVDGWRPWYVDGQVAGYTTSYSNNLTFATVKGAGHTAPEYMPTQCLAMLSRWLAGDPL